MSVVRGQLSVAQIVKYVQIVETVQTLRSRLKAAPTDES